MADRRRGPVPRDRRPRSESGRVKVARRRKSNLRRRDAHAIHQRKVEAAQLANYYSWKTYADDQIGLMDYLGIDNVMVMGFRIGGPFVWNLLKRAPDRIVAAVLAQPSGSRPEMRRPRGAGARDTAGLARPCMLDGLRWSFARTRCESGRAAGARAVGS